MKVVNACPMKVFYKNTFNKHNEMWELIRQLLDNWGQYPQIVLAGHGDAGYSAIIEPAHKRTKTFV